MEGDPTVDGVVREGQHQDSLQGIPGGSVVKNPPANKVQQTRVQSLVWEDPTCCGATKPVSDNYWACALEPGSRNY